MSDKKKTTIETLFANIQLARLAIGTISQNIADLDSLERSGKIEPINWGYVSEKMKGFQNDSKHTMEQVGALKSQKRSKKPVKKKVYAETFTELLNGGKHGYKS